MTWQNPSPATVRQSGLLALGEQLPETALRFAQTFVSEHNRLLLPNGIADQTLLMKLPHGFPIDVPPRGNPIVKREIENRENRFVHLCGIDLRSAPMP